MENVPPRASSTQSLVLQFTHWSQTGSLGRPGLDTTGAERESLRTTSPSRQWAAGCDLCCRSQSTGSEGRPGRSQAYQYTHTQPRNTCSSPALTNYNPSRQQDARWGLESDLFLRKWNRAGVARSLWGGASGSGVKAAGAAAVGAHSRHTLRLLDSDSITWSNALHRGEGAAQTLNGG